MRSRLLQAGLDKFTGPIRRLFQYAAKNWIREMPKSKRIITWGGISLQGFAIY
jgi:hypothetical protein